MVTIELVKYYAYVRAYVRRKVFSCFCRHLVTCHLPLDLWSLAKQECSFFLLQRYNIRHVKFFVL